MQCSDPAWGHPAAVDPSDALHAGRQSLVLGVPLAADRLRADARLDRRHGRRPQPGYVCVCNVHTVMASAEDPELRGALLGSSLNVPDGQPLVWALNALGHSLEDRVYGPELMARACARAPTPASASTSTAGATRARWCSWRSTSASAIPASRSSAATRRRTAR